MEIRESNSYGVELSQLRAGKVFRYNGEIYMRTDEDSELNLRTGCLEYFDERSQVAPVECYLQITE